MLLARILVQNKDQLKHYWSGFIKYISLVFGVVWGLSRKRTAFEAARIADSRLGLKERIASALEFERDPARKAIYDLQARDADQHAAQIDIRRVFPHRFTKEAKLALAVGLALAVA